MIPFLYGVPSGTIPPAHAQEFYRDRLADGWKWIRVERLCKENNIPNYRMMRDLKKHRATGPKLIWDLGLVWTSQACTLAAPGIATRG